MLKKTLLISVALLSTTFTSATQAFTENWLTTDRISNQREVKIQIDKDFKPIQTRQPNLLKERQIAAKRYLALYSQMTKDKIKSAAMGNGSLTLHTKTIQAMS